MPLSVDERKILNIVSYCRMEGDFLYCNICPYYTPNLKERCIDKLKEDCKKILQPRVLKQSELKNFLRKPLYFESKNEHKWIVFKSQFYYYCYAEYGKDYRIWSNEPTEEEMKNTPWNEDE